MRRSTPCVILALALALSARAAAAQELAAPLPAHLGAPPIVAAPATIGAQAAPAADPITLEFTPRAGFAARLGSSGSLPITGRYGGVGGLGVAIAPWPRAAIGLAWERSAVGSEHGHGDLADVEVSRMIDVVWASLRLYLLRLPRFQLSVQLGPGLAIQHAAASVLLYPDATLRPTSYTCHETAGPGLALRAGLGVEARLAGPLWITADADVDHAQLSSGPLGDCAPGAGSLSLAGGRFGLLYRADVTRWLR